MAQIKFQGDHPTQLVFPFTKEFVDNLGPNKLVSPRPGDAHGIQNISDEQRYEEMEDVERVRYEVNKGIWPGWWFEKHGISPDVSPVLRGVGVSGNNAKAAAHVVKMDHPFDLMDKAVRPWVESNKIAWKDPVTHQGPAFVETVQREAAAHSMIAHALDKVFDVKYYYGSPRPYEYSDYGKNIELFPCPKHPEFPAGHGAVAGATYKIFVLQCAPTEEQRQEVEKATKQFAMFRSLSAMHIASANLIGWELGANIDTIPYGLKELK